MLILLYDPASFNFGLVYRIIGDQCQQMITRFSLGISFGLQFVFYCCFLPYKTIHH